MKITELCKLLELEGPAKRELYRINSFLGGNGVNC